MTEIVLYFSHKKDLTSSNLKLAWQKRCRWAGISVLLAAIVLLLGSSLSMAQPRAHVYLLRGLMNIFSLGMDTLATELTKRGVYATVYNYSVWQRLADQAAARYKAGTEGPIILIGHSLGADAVMEMAAYLGRKGVPVALVVPFDGTGSYAASSNVSRVMNLTQRNYAYMRRGPGFHGTLANVDVSSDHNIDHLNIDKSPRLHTRVIAEVLAIVGNHGIATPNAPKPASTGAPAAGGETNGAKAAPAAGGAAKPE
jgi:pimeloyl-ACP methyl ester carboxylesterase